MFLHDYNHNMNEHVVYICKSYVHNYIYIYIHSLSIYGLCIKDTASDSYFACISKAGWQVDVEQSLLQTQRRLGLVNAGPPEDCQKDFDALRNKKTLENSDC